MRARLLSVVVALSLAWVSIPAAHAEPNDQSRDSDAATWLSTQGGSDSLLETNAGTGDPSLTLDGVLALIAANGSHEVIDAWLKAVEPEFAAKASDFGFVGKTTLALAAAGRSTTSFGGANPHDLAAASLKGSPEAGWARDTNAFGQSYVMLGLARSGSLPAETVSFLVGKQCADGGFPVFFTAGASCAQAGSSSDPDATAIVIMALRAAGSLGSDEAREALTKAAAFMATLQNTNGSFNSAKISGSVENANTTGLAAAALSGIDEPVVARAREWMSSSQVMSGAEEGAIAYAPADLSAGIGTLDRGVWVRATTQGIFAFAAVDFSRLRLDISATPGSYEFGNRDWRTTCDQPSSCRTDIQVPVVSRHQDGVFSVESAWIPVAGAR